MRPQRRFTLKIKRSLRRLRQRSPKLPFAYNTNRNPRTRQTPVQNNLPRYPIALRKYRPQALVPLNYVPKRSFQRSNIKKTPQPYRQRDRVARTTSFQPLQKPQPTLRKRQRNFRRTQNRTQRRTRNSPIPKPINQQCHRRRFKQAADRYLNIKARPQPADQTRRKKRVSPKREEVILDPYSLDTQNLRKQPAQNLLTRRARRPKTAPANRRRRQRSTVKLPVRRQRKNAKLHYRRRHHVVRKPRTNMRAQLHSINRTARRRNHIANKLPAPSPLSARNHRSLRHTRVTAQRRLDLPRLNAETTHLDLMVGATHKLQNSIKPPPRQVPAAVHPCSRSAKPVRYKTLPSEPTAPDIAPTNTTPRDVKLPNYPNCHRLQTIIQNVNTRVPNRTTDRRYAAPGQCLTHCRADRRLRRSIRVDHPPAR